MPLARRQPVHPELKAMHPAPDVVTRIRAAAIRECVTWLARHSQEYKTHALAGALADDMLPEETR